MKKGFKLLYACLGATTLALASGLTVWAALGERKNDEEISLVSPPLLQEPSARGEYLVGETFNPIGLYLELGERSIAASDCELTYDFSSAGHKVVTLSYKEEDTQYEGYYNVEVFGFRHLDIRDKTVSRKGNGEWDTSRIVVWAELTSAPTEFEKPIEFPSPSDTVIVVPSSMYTVNVKDTGEEGFFTVEVSAGPLTSNFTYIEPSSDRPYVDSIDRILHLENASGTKDELTLYAETSTNNFAGWGGEGSNEVNGTYVLKKEDGSKKQYRFSYRIDGWESYFLSSTFNEGLTDAQGYGEDGDAYQVNVEGLVFYSRGPAWHKAVLNMNG